MAVLTFIGAPGGGFLGSAESEASVDISTTAVDPVFTTIVSVSLETTGNDIELSGAAAYTSSAFAGVVLRIQVDGVPVVGGLGISLSSVVGGCALAQKLRHPVGAGLHTVDLQIAKVVGSAAATVVSVLAASSPDKHFGTLRVREHAS